MSKLSAFKVSFSNAQRVYYAGQTVQGNVIIELTEAMKMRGVRLKLLGKANVHWTEKVSSGQRAMRRTRHFTASEIYFDEDILLAGRWKNHSGDEMHLSAGSHVYPFAFQLPPQLPSSFEGAHGYVRYTVKGIIDKPWKFDHVTRKPFTVVCLLDLNTEPKAIAPAQGTDSKHFCCLCCASGQVSATFALDRRGYVPGEAITIKAEIDNKSNRKMASSSVVMYMTVIFRATNKTRRKMRTVAELTHGEIREGETDYWNGDQLIIPPLPPSFLIGCSIIDIRYSLELQVDPSGPGFDLEVPLDIILGTVPLQHVLAENPPMPPPVGRAMVISNTSAIPQAGQPYPPRAGIYTTDESVPQEMLSAAPAYPPGYPTDIPNYPPPSYGECVFGKVNLKYDDDNAYSHGDTNFTPVYTYYDWGYKPADPPQQEEYM